LLVFRFQCFDATVYTVNKVVQRLSSRVPAVALKMTDMKMTDHQNCKARNCTIRL